MARAMRNFAIRLVAENGERVKADLREIGDTGEDAFGRMEARSVAFSRSVTVAMAAAAAAVAAAAGAMIRDGMRKISAQADLAESLNTTVESVQVLHHAAELVGVATTEAEGGVRRLTRRLSLFAKDGGGPAAKAIEQLNLNAAELLTLPIDQRLAVVNDALDKYASEAERAALLSQLFGDNSWMAFSRLDTATVEKATEDLRAFGVIVSEQDAAKITRTGEALSRLGLIWRGLANQLTVAVAPAIELVVSAMSMLASRTGPLGRAIEVVVGNLDRLMVYATSLAGFLAGRWVFAFAAARAATLSLAGALGVLTAAIARTGIGALVVLTGELVYQLLNVIQRVGSLGKSFQLLGNIGRAVFSELGQAGRALAEVMASVAWAIPKAFIDGFKWIAEAWDGLVNWMATPFNLLMESLGRDFRLFADSGLPELLGGPSDWLGERAQHHSDRASAIFGEMEQTQAAIEALAEAMKSVAEEAGGAADLPLDLLDKVSAAAGRATQKAVEQKDAADDLIASLRQELAVLRELDPVKRKMLEYSDQLADATARQREQVRELVEALREQEHGLSAISRKLAGYADEAGRIGSDIGVSLVGAFSRAEDAVADFVKTGKLNFSDFVTSIISDLARISTRHFITGPLSGALSDSLSDAGGIFANLFHSGGLVGAGGPGRMVPAMAFAGAPRMHGGGIARLRSDEVPAILQKGERVLSRREAAGYGGVTVNIQARDVESFRQSRSQITADIARAVNLGRRGM